MAKRTPPHLIVIPKEQRGGLWARRRHATRGADRTWFKFQNRKSSDTEMIGAPDGGDQPGGTICPWSGPHRSYAKTAPTLVQHDSLPPREK